MRNAYAVAQIATLIWLLLSGFWRRFPMFCWYLTISSLVTVAYNPESPTWLQRIWLPLEPSVLLLRAAAVAECAWGLAFWSRQWPRLVTGLVLLTGALVTIVWITPNGAAIDILVQARRYVHIGLAAFLLLLIAFLLSQGMWRWTSAHRHAIVFGVFLLMQAAIALMAIRFGKWPPSWWRQVDAAGFAVATACCIGWVTSVAPAYVRETQSEVRDSSRTPRSGYAPDDRHPV
jgi:hypothetical protein